VPIPKNKEELIIAIVASYDKLKKDLDSIPTSLTDKKELEGHVKGTLMSIADLVSYLIGWGELVLKWNKKKEKNETVHFPEKGYKWNELGKLAQKFYNDYESLDYHSLLVKLDKTVNEILELVKKTNNTELYKKPWYGKWTLGKMIQLNTSSPYKNARIRARKWMKINQDRIEKYH